MRNILDFIIRHLHWLLFVLLQTVAAVMLFRFNSFQGSVWFTSASAVTARISCTVAGVKSYFGLRETNKELAERNVLLMQELQRYKELYTQDVTECTTPQLLKGVKQIIRTDSNVTVIEEPPVAMEDSLIVSSAHVVNISVRRYDNYIAIDKGRKDGVKAGMGVISGNGVVGIVCRVSDNFALVLPVINSKSSISCKIARTEYFGFLKWEGGDPLIVSMTDVPRHAEYELGDTVVTSGHSTVFTEGIPVGTVINRRDSDDGMSFTFDVKLFTDYGRLNDVFVMALPPRGELVELEKDIEF